MDSTKRVLVIGAGISGLAAIKACLEEGLSVTCYELSNDVGGLWKYREDDLEEVSSMFWNMYTNTSKEMSAFSDFPMPKEFPNYMHHTLFQQYLELYAENFHLEKKIKFKHKVLNLAPDESYESTGRWKVQVQDLGEGTKSTKEFVYDAVIVATGQNNFPVYPTIEGIEEFKGQTMHSRRYKKPEPFRDKRVLVYGFGNSAIDIATDLAGKAKKVYLSCKRTKWVIKRMMLNGKFGDAEWSKRSLELFMRFLPKNWVNFVEERRLNSLTDHNLLGLTPNYRLLDRLPSVTETLPTCILLGTVDMKPNIAEMTSDGVVFEGSNDVLPIDTVISATGFKAIFPFVSNDIIDVQKRPDDLFKWIFPIHLQHHTIAFLGLTIPDKANTVVTEMESRWAVSVFNGKTNLPPRDAMLAQTQKYISALKSSYGSDYLPTRYVHCYPHVDEIASFIGAKPNLTKMLFTDPKLFWKCFFEPFYSYQYRLNGPHSWDGAREAIFSAEDRTRYPFWKDRPPTKANSRWIHRFLFLITIFLGFSFYVYS